MKRDVTHDEVRTDPSNRCATPLRTLTHIAHARLRDLEFRGSRSRVHAVRRACVDGARTSELRSARSGDVIGRRGRRVVRDRLPLRSRRRATIQKIPARR